VVGGFWVSGGFWVGGRFWVFWVVGFGFFWVVGFGVLGCGVWQNGLWDLEIIGNQGIPRDTQGRCQLRLTPTQVHLGAMSPKMSTFKIFQKSPLSPPLV
jgi:hypothetical protein